MTLYLLPGCMLNTRNIKRPSHISSIGELTVIQRAEGPTDNYTTVWKGVGVFEKDMGTQSRERISQAGVMEGLAEVTIFESGQGRQIEFQQTARGEMNKLGSEKRPSKGMKTGEDCGFWEHEGEVPLGEWQEVRPEM